MYIRSLTWVYCICHEVYCRGHHLTSGTTLGCTSGASLGWVHCICHQDVCTSYHVNQEPHMVYCICQQVYCICHHVHQKLHLGVLHLLSSVLQRASSNIRNNTGVYFRSPTLVYCRGHHLTSETTLRCTSGVSLGCTAFAIKCTAVDII